MDDWEGFHIKQCRRNQRYAVSNRGDAYRSKRDGTLKRLRPLLDDRGRPHVHLGRGRGQQPERVRVSRLVAESFLGDPPEGKTLVLHWDDDRRNNEVGNLRYGDHSDNWRDAVRNGRRVLKHSDQAVDRVRELGRAGWNLRAISDATGVSESHASRILSGQRRRDRFDPDCP